MAADPMAADDDARLLCHPRAGSPVRIDVLCGNSWASIRVLAICSSVLMAASRLPY